MGGLHENVFNSALFMRDKNCNVTILLKDGPLKEKFNDYGINTFTTDFENIDNDMAILEKCNIKFDLIHFHPGKSRFVAIEFSKKYNIPTIYTVHGKWHGKLKTFINDLSAVVTVSEGISDYLKSTLNISSEKYNTIPNGFNPNLFHSPVFYKEKEIITIGYITRFDEDKKFILDILQQVNDYLSKYYRFQVRILLVGDGSLKEQFMLETKNSLASSLHYVEDLGWLQEKDLRNAYASCDIVVAPGRSVIEAMATGKPVIAVGSKNYIGLINKETWQYGVYNNFGGIGNKHEDYNQNKLYNDLDSLLLNTNNILEYGKFSYHLAQKNFNDNDIQYNLYKLYKLTLLSHTL